MSEVLSPENGQDADPLSEREIEAVSQRMQRTVEGARGLKEGRAYAVAIHDREILASTDALSMIAGRAHLYGVDHKPLFAQVRQTLDSIPVDKKGYSLADNRTAYPVDKGKSLLKLARGQRLAGISPFDTLAEIERLLHGNLTPSDNRVLYYQMAQGVASAGNPEEAVRKINRGPDAPEVICYVARDDAILAVMREQLYKNGPDVATNYLRGITDPGRQAEALSLLGDYFVKQQDTDGVQTIIDKLRRHVPSMYFEHQQAKALADAVELACAIGEIRTGKQIFEDIPTAFANEEQARALGIIIRTLHNDGKDVDAYLNAMRELVLENAQKIAARTDMLGNKDIIRQAYEFAATQKACGVKEYDDIIAEVETILTFPANVRDRSGFVESDFALQLGTAYQALGSYEKVWGVVPFIKVPSYRFALYEETYTQKKPDIIPVADIAHLSTNTTSTLLQKSTQAAYAIGRFGSPVTEITLATLPPPSQLAVRLGRAEKVQATAFWEDRPLSAEETKLLRRDIREARTLQRSQPADVSLAAQLVDGLTGGQPTSAASNHLVDMVKSFTNLPPDIALCVFDGLLRIGNRKALQVGNDLYLRADLPITRKQRIAQKLMQHGYWDTALLKQEGVLPDETNQDSQAIYQALVGQLRLTPDVQSYNALATPGLLQGATLRERIAELGQTRDTLSKMSGEALIAACGKDEKLAKVYYMTADKKDYATPSGYTLDHFMQMVRAIDGVAVHQATVKRYKDALRGVTKRGGILPAFFSATPAPTGLSEQDAAAVIADLTAGKPLVTGDTNEFVFPITLDSEEQFRIARDRFTQVWTQELPHLMISAKLQHHPATVEEAMTSAQDPQTNAIRRELKDILYRFNMQRSIVDMQTYVSIQRQVAQDLSLPTDQMPTVEDIARYFEQYLPHTPAASEWSTHFIESITHLEQATQERKGPSKRTNIRMSFLDKSDLARVTRFADGFISCIHSSSTDNFKRSLNVVARVIKDPLSLPVEFSVDDTVTGYTFLLSAIDPKTGYPGWLVNGIYDGNKNPAMVQKVLQLIEEHPAARINAGFIGIASKYGGVIEQPVGYTPVPALGISLEAIRATGSFGPEKKKYDDTGVTANGGFRFGGYKWPVEQKPNGYIKYLR